MPSMSASSQAPGRDTGAPSDPSGERAFEDGRVASTTPDPSDRGGDGRDTRRGLADRLAGVVWWVGLVLIALVAAAAIAMTIGVLLDVFGGGIDRGGLIYMAVAAVIAAAAVGVLILVVQLARRGNEAWAVGIGLATIGITRAVAIAAIPTPLTTDWGDYHNTAVILASGGGFDSARPPGWPLVLSLLYRVAGPESARGRDLRAPLCGRCRRPHLPHRPAMAR